MTLTYLDLRRRHGCCCTLPCHLRHETVPLCPVSGRPACHHYRSLVSYLAVALQPINPSFEWSSFGPGTRYSRFKRYLWKSVIGHSLDVTKEEHSFVGYDVYYCLALSYRLSDNCVLNFVQACYPQYFPQAHHFKDKEPIFILF